MRVRNSFSGKAAPLRRSGETSLCRPTSTHIAACFHPALRVLRTALVGFWLATTMVYAAAEVRRQFDIAEGKAARTLKALAAQAQREILYSPQAVAGVRTRAVRGDLTPRAALTQLLEATVLRLIEEPGSGAWMVVRRDPPPATAPPENGSRTPSPMQTPNESQSRLSPRANSNRSYFATLLLFLSPPAVAGEAPRTETGDITVLSPFVVATDKDTGYAATSTLAGTRLRTNLSDVGASVSVLTKEFLTDVGGTDSDSVLAYATNMEVSSVRGNYISAGTGSFGNNDESARMLNPSSSTRVRGLVSADNTRNYFRTNVAWDSYNVSRIDMLRGPNGILFGLGSPGGVINASTDAANLQRESGEVGAVTDQFGSFRGTFNFNRPILRNQLAVRGALLSERAKFRQEPSHEDKDRLFVAATYRPSFLNRGGMTLELSFDYEGGRTKSNRPRLAPPVDSFTPYLTGLTINPIQLPAGTNFLNYPNGQIPGATYAIIGYQVPYADNFGGTPPPGVGTSFDANGIRYLASYDNSFSPQWIVGRGNAYGVRNANGTIQTANPFSNALFGADYSSRLISPLNTFAQNIGHPFGSAFTPTSLRDASVFDFHNTLLDGPNKREWSEFDQRRVVLATTFFKQRLGLELSHFQEWTEYGQTTLMGDNARIMIDINAFLRDGAPNPNAGRAYVQETTYAANRIRLLDIEGSRASAYLDYDLRREKVGPRWLQWIVGRNVFNGAVQRDETAGFNRDFQRHVYPDILLTEGVGRPGQRFNNNTRTGMQYYISGNLTGRTSLSGLNLSSLRTPILDEIGQAPITVQVFDPTWIAPANVAFNAPWVNPRGQTSTQSANPANYRGWVNKQYSLIDALSGNPDDLALATRSATLNYNKVDSRVLSWQGYLLDGALVATVGWRKDESLAKQKNSTGRPDGGANLDPAVFNYGTGNQYELSVESRNHSGVVHLNRLPKLDFLPVRVALSYNKGENFNPTAGRIDKLARPLPPPAGSTEEYGVLLATKDGRYSLKVTKYETAITGASSGAVANEFQMQQLLGLNGAASAYEAANGLLRAEYEAQTTPPSWSIDDQEKISAPAWYAMESALRQQFPTFVNQWLVQGNGGTYAPSNDRTTFSIGGTNTADTVSKGYEIEFTANPTRELRLTVNASKTDAFSDNVPGAATQAIYEFLNQSFWDGITLTAAGRLRTTNDPFGVNGTMGEWFRNNLWPNYLVVLQRNGQRNTDLVEWRFNALANYTFNEGRLKGFGVGGSYRWESERSVGYPRYFDQFGIVTADIAHPFMAPKNDRIDVNFSYRRKLTKRIDWRVQLNVYNAIGGNKLVPVTVNPDGGIGLMRIQEGRSWRLSNTFSF